ncbi:MAG: 2-oxoacid:acceptor oxidoreductase family protein [Candidatus Syntropharchaeia archaeon]
MKIGVRLAGFGGQGLIFASVVLAKAAAIYESKKEGREIYAIQTQIYGPAARGGTSKAEVLISDEKIDYPFLDVPDVLVLMSQPSYEKYGSEVKEDTVIILDPDVVMSRPKMKYYEIPATSVAELLGNKVVANMVMLGALCGITGIVSEESVKKAMLEKVPEGSEELNIRALERGFELGKERL